MTKEDVMVMITRANEWADHVYDVLIPELLGAKNGKIRLNQWFDARNLISKIGLYDQNWKVLQQARAAGYDVKMNMQDYKLSYHGKI